MFAESAYVPKSFEAALDLSASQHCMVVLNTSNRVELCGDGGLPVGVLVNDPDAAGRAAAVMNTPGETVLIKTGGAFSIGDRLGCDSTGRAVSAATADQIIGEARAASGGANEVVPVLFQPQGVR